VLDVHRNGLAELDVLDLATRARRTFPARDVLHSVYLADNRELDAPFVRVYSTSYLSAGAWSAWDFATGKVTVLKETPVPGGFEPQRYVTERIEAVAKDGTRIPISLAYRKDVTRDGAAPVWLEGYGAYGVQNDVTFSPAAVVLMDRGVVLATAHVRGGGELGKAWHEQGRLAAKMNTFTDFIACAEHLVAARWTRPSRLVVQGGSAGGLLMGAVTNLRPELFQAVIADVPFVDVITTMSDPSLPLTVTEYEEWGNPARPEEYAWLRAYSPYDNLAAKGYPAMLVRSSYNDSQVFYVEPAKYVARMRALKTDARPLYFHIDMSPAGHGGKSGRYEQYREVAQEQAFGLWQLGLGPIPPR
jgi:oligopeptidase B